MVSYPEGLPFDAAMIVTNAVRNGLAEKGTHGDLACVVHAGWNLVGFGLGVGLPHVHTFADARTSIADLPELLSPLAVKGDLPADAKALPWAKILPLLFALLQVLLAEKEA
jgi:hypothetical protein